MIYGIGTDICATERINSIMQKKYAYRFIARILTDKEMSIYNALSASRQIEFLAGRFAMKEAISKALGTGIGELFGFHDVSIINESSGKPACEFSDQFFVRLPFNKKSMKCHVSISHEKTHVIAFAIIEQ